jgi:glutamyl-tRNA synthetase
MREAGIEPAALVAKLARIGTSLSVEPFADHAPLIESFDFSTFGRAPARFDMAELEALNARIVHQLDFAAARDRLPAGMSEADWSAIRPNLTKVSDASDWWEILHGHVEQAAPPEDRDYLAAAAEAAAAIDWEEAPWASLTAGLKETSGRTGKALFHPLRRALTGRDSGPDMAALLPLIGRNESISRLRAAASAAVHL